MLTLPEAPTKASRPLSRRIDRGVDAQAS